MRRRDFLAVGAASMAVASWPSRIALAATSDGWLAASMPSSKIQPADAWAPVFERLPPSLRGLIDDPQYQIQLIWTRIVRDARGRPRLRRAEYGLTPQRWFSAASVSKLPMALLMAERLSAHGLNASAEIRLSAAPETGEWPADEPLSETFQRGCNRTFAVSENVPFNRWYEYLGADAVHARLARLGYPDTRLIARLGSSDREANRRSRGGALLAADGRIVERTEAMTAAERRFPFGSAMAGSGWQNDDGSVALGPRDFSYANFMPLADSLGMLQAFVLPETVPAKRRWRIAEPLRAQLLKALALRPRDSDDPRYDEAEHYDGYARWFLVGDGKQRYPEGLRVSGKSGMAYGYLSEVAHLQDRDAGAECLLAAAIHVNRDGIYNDDRYEYDSIGLPFLAALGRAVLDVERDARLNHVSGA
jgi:Beta-lactamase enzyme family